MAEISSAMNEKEILYCLAKDKSHHDFLAKSIRRNKVPLSNFSAFKDGKQLLEPWHDHFLGMKLTNSLQFKNTMF